MLCPKVAKDLLETIRHVEEDNCPGCALLKPIVLLAKISPVYLELLADQNGSASTR